MEIRQLKYAVQVAAEQSFSKAAAKLHIAQPSLSQQISKLEDELGILLFIRSTSAVELTHAGTVFVEKAQEVLDMVEQIQKEMDDLSQMRKGKLMIGSLPITGSHLLPLVLPVFRERYKDIELVLVEDTTNNLEELTSKGQTDLTLLSLPLINHALDYEPILEEEIVLAVPKDHRLAQSEHAVQKAVPIAELRHEPFIILKRGQGFRQITIDLCQQAGYEPRIVFESTNIETVQSLVAAGMGIAFVPEMVSRTRSDRFSPAYLHLKEKPYRTLVISYRRGRYLSKAAKAFIETMKEVLHTR